MKTKMKQLIYISGLSIFLITSGLFYSGTVNKILYAADSSTEVKSSIIKLKIDGMFCGSCSYSARKALKNVNNVKNAEVDYSSGTAKVYPKEGTSVNINELIRSIEKIGFKARVIKSS